MILKIIAFPFMCLFSLLVLMLLLFTIPIFGILALPFGLIIGMWQEDVGTALECVWEFMFCPVLVVRMMWDA